MCFLRHSNIRQTMTIKWPDRNLLLTNDHEPSCNIRELSANRFWREDIDPRILSTSDWVFRAHLGHGIGYTERYCANSNPAPNHDWWSTCIHTGHQDTSQCTPTISKMSIRLLLIFGFLRMRTMSRWRRRTLSCPRGRKSVGVLYIAIISWITLVLRMEVVICRLSSVSMSFKVKSGVLTRLITQILQSVILCCILMEDLLLSSRLHFLVCSRIK